MYIIMHVLWLVEYVSSIRFALVKHLGGERHCES